MMLLGNNMRKKKRKQGNITSHVKQVTKPVVALRGSVPPVLRYVPRSRCEKGESSFSE